MRILTGRLSRGPAASRLAACCLATLVMIGAPGRLAAADGAIACAKAEAADEKAICADPALVEDDARMAVLFKAAMNRSGMGERGDLEDGQAAWLDRRHACAADLPCLRAAYAGRIKQIQAVIDALGGPT